MIRAVSAALAGFDSRWFFPCLSIAINVGAVIVHISKRDLWGAGYWLFAAGITTCATFGRK